MARASSLKDPTVKSIVPGGAIGRPRPTGEVLPGQLIVRFKPEAVREVAAHPVAMGARAGIAAAAMPDDVAGPLALLKAEAGMVSVKPLFVTGAKIPQPRSGTDGDGGGPRYAGAFRDPDAGGAQRLPIGRGQRRRRCHRRS